MLKPIKIRNLIINKPVFPAPLAGISDIVFRSLIKEMGVEVCWSEMISATALKYNENPKYIADFNQEQHPIFVQLFGSQPDCFPHAIKLMEKRGADVIDFNCGCPVPKVIKQKSGSFLHKEPELFAEIIKIIRNATEKPVSVKIRSGWSKDEINAVEMAKIAEDEGADIITVHPRTRSQAFKGESDWTVIEAVKKAVKIPVIGNGDINSPQDAIRMIETTKCDGIMIGRASIGNPWIFRETLSYIFDKKEISKPSLNERLLLADKHAEMLCNYKGEKVAMKEMRKYLIKYFKGINNASNFRIRLSQVLTLTELRVILDDIKAQKLEYDADF